MSSGAFGSISNPFRFDGGYASGMKTGLPPHSPDFRALIVAAPDVIQRAEGDGAEAADERDLPSGEWAGRYPGAIRRVIAERDRFIHGTARSA